MALKFIDCRTRPAGTVAGEVRMLRSLTGLRHNHFIALLGIPAYDTRVAGSG